MHLSFIATLLCLVITTPTFVLADSSKKVAKTFNKPPLAESNRTDTKCDAVETDQNGLVYNCHEQFPSQSQLQTKLHQIEALAIIQGNFEELTIDKYITSTTLKKLSLAKCNIREIQTHLFATTPNLESLDLNGNSLSVLENELLKDLPNLVLLSLADNQIHTIKSDVFASTEKLAYLFLSNNSLSEVPKQLPNGLKVLHASKNKISKVDSIISLPNAEEIDLCENNIESITATIICPSLKTLCLSGEKLNWNSQSLTASMTKQITDLTLTGYSNRNSFPRSLAMFLSQNRTLITQLTIRDYKIKELELPLALVRLSLIHVASDSEKNLFKLYPPTLQVVDVTASPTVASKLINEQPRIFDQQNIQQVIFRDCNLQDLAMFERDSSYPILNCSIGGNDLDCDDEKTREIICSSADTTRIAIQGLDTVTCLSDGRPWDNKLCEKYSSDRRTGENNPHEHPTVSTEIPDSEHGHDRMSTVWFIVIAIMILLIILMIALIVWRSRKQSRSNNLVMEEQTTHTQEA